MTVTLVGDRTEVEIDALVAAQVFGFDRAQLEYVLDSFEKLCAREVAEHGRFRTRQLVLERFDAIERARTSGARYRPICSPELGASLSAVGHASSVS